MSKSVLLIVAGLFLTGLLGNKEFMLYRYTPMDGFMPPLEPIQVKDKLTCALYCIEDAACGSFSHSNVTEMCQLSDEIWRYQDISISHFNGHFYHFNVYETLQHNKIMLPHGYRWHPHLLKALRYHFLRPLNLTDAGDYCVSEGGHLVVIDTQNKTDVIQSAITLNNKMSREVQPFLVTLSNGTESMEPKDGSGQCRGINKLYYNYTFTAIPCEYQYPYICEISHSQLGITL